MCENCERRLARQIVDPALLAANDRMVNALKAIMGVDAESDVTGAEIEHGSGMAAFALALGAVPRDDLDKVVATSAAFGLNYLTSGYGPGRVMESLTLQAMLLGWLLHDEQVKQAGA
jgi:hypothetical protein